MAILTATQVTLFTNISASVTSIIASGLIDVVQDRVTTYCNNYFTSDLYVRGFVTFDGTARTISASSSFETAGFAAGDEIYIYRSYRNDGYHDVLSVSGETLTLATGETVVAELSGRSVLISVVQWPSDIVYAAAQMVAYDYDVRPKRAAGVSSRSLGPWSESYEGGGSGAFGYPADLLGPLNDHKIVRAM
jgi:hypothetical protein